MRSAISVERLTTTRDLEVLRDEWHTLWGRCPNATPFQHPAWLIPWWRHLAEGDLLALACRRDGRLVGLVPLFVYRNPRNGSRDLLPIGCGTSDYLDALCEPEEARDVLAAVFHELERDRSWDAIELTQLRTCSPLLRAALPDAWREDHGDGEPCPVLALDPQQSLEAAVPTRMLQNLRYYRRRAEQRGATAVERASPENVGEFFSDLVRLHDARWSRLGVTGVLADPRVQRMHAEALPNLSQRNLLRFYRFSIGGRVAACFYGFSDGAAFYYYLGAFDPDLADLSPGTLVIAHAIEEALREGAARFDFLRGRESYKYLWGAQDSSTYRRRAFLA